MYFLVAYRFLMGQQPVLPPFLEGFASIGVGGKLYSKFGIGLSLLLMPLLSISMLIGSLIPGWVWSGDSLRSVALLLNPLVGATGIYLLYRVLKRHFTSDNTATVISVMTSFSGLWLAYTRTLFTEVSVAVLFLLSVDGFYRDDRRGDVILGLASAVTVLIRLDTVLFVAPLILYRLWKTGRVFRLLLPGIFSGVVIGLYNQLRFGWFLETGMGSSTVEGFTTPLLLGWYGQFFAVGNGLFVYAPYLGLSAGYLSWLYFREREFHGPTLTIWLSVVLYISLHATWFSWMGGWSWGPRRMIPLLLLAHLPVAWIWDRIHGPHRKLLLGLVIISTGINLPGMISDFNEYYRRAFYQYDVLFEAEHSQIYRQWMGLWNGGISLDLFWLNMTGSWMLIPILLIIAWFGLLSFFTRNL